MVSPETLDQIANHIRKGRRAIFLTSAGMSADSNIPTFRDRDGYWSNFPPFKAKNLEAQHLASPWAFRNVLPHAWAFYEWRRRNAMKTSRMRDTMLSTDGCANGSTMPSSTPPTPMDTT